MALQGVQKALRIGWIGAGSINFGSLEGPWNHAIRLQKQNDLQFTAVVDTNLDLAKVLQASYQVVTTVRAVDKGLCVAARKSEPSRSSHLYWCRKESRNIRQVLSVISGLTVKLFLIITACLNRQQTRMEWSSAFHPDFTASILKLRHSVCNALKPESLQGRLTSLPRLWN